MKEIPKVGVVKDAKKDFSEIQKSVVKCASARISVRSIICAIQVMESAHASQIMLGNYVMNVPLVMQIFQCNARRVSAMKVDQLMNLAIP